MVIHLLVKIGEKKGPPWGKQISLGLGLQNRGKIAMQLFATARGSRVWSKL